MKAGFIGLGLIGGSIAKTMRSKQKNVTLVAFDTNTLSLQQALEQGVVDTACSSIDDNFKDCDFIFLCAPVHSNTVYLELLKPYLKDGCILTDAGSVKSEIHEFVNSHHLNNCFIGGHPMAGSEKSGFPNSSDHLFENVYYILTPTKEVPTHLVEKYRALVSSFDAIPLVMDYKEHDYVTAAISHVPHIIASSLVNLVRDSDNSEGIMKMIAAGGFKDITRIASSSPTMWQQICMANGDSINHFLTEYIDSLSIIKGMIQTKSVEEIYSVFATARDYRDSITDVSAGPIKKIYALYCDIIDESGAIATIATMLATNHISIKNIGIIHNREFEEGALRIEFSGEQEQNQAAEILEKHHYTIYKR